MNDVGAAHRLGNVFETPWPQLLAQKKAIVRNDTWFDVCNACDDDYRWILLDRQALDEPLDPATG